MFYLMKGENDKAIECVEKMAHYAIAFDSLPETQRYSSVLLNTIEYKNERYESGVGVPLCAKLIRGRFSGRVWSAIRNNPRFIAAIDKMEQLVK